MQISRLSVEIRCFIEKEVTETIFSWTNDGEDDDSVYDHDK